MVNYEAFSLFGGRTLEDGSLSNAHFLSDEIPPKFLDKANHWVVFAKKFTFESISEREWKWEPENDDVRLKQLKCVTAALATPYLSEVKKRGIVAWMLFNMLQELPDGVL